MYVEKIEEPVRVFADFSGSKVRPVAFIRRTGRRYDVKSVNLVYRRRVGDKYRWCFAVSDEANTYTLFYDPESLVWTLKELQTDG